MAQKHFFSFEQIKPQKSANGCYRTTIGNLEVTSFSQISFEKLQLAKNCSTEPFWHPNAHKLGYCIQGELVVSLLTASAQDTFTVKEGEVFFIPKGSFHFLANGKEKEAIVTFAYSHVKPEELHLSKAIHSLSEFAFQATFHSGAGFFGDLQKSKEDPTFINNYMVKAQAPVSSRYKFDMQESSDYVSNKGGYLKAATKPNMPIIEELGLFSFGLNPQGIVEPHWHTNAGELIYVIKGDVKISILSADGSHDVQQVKAGGGAFAPANYFHSIENLSKDSAEILAFFSNPTPDYIGIGQAVNLCPKEILASTFNLPVDTFKAFTAPNSALVITI